jgi:hypothetical protein
LLRLLWEALQKRLIGLSASGGRGGGVDFALGHSASDKLLEFAMLAQSLAVKMPTPLCQFSRSMPAHSPGIRI